MRKLECKCKWKAHRNQSVWGNMQVVMECNDKGKQIYSLRVDQSASTANANITKQAYTIYHQTNISVSRKQDEVWRSLLLWKGCK